MADTSAASRDIDRFREFLRTGKPGTHAYAVLLGIGSFDLPSLLKLVEKGFAWKTLERFGKNAALRVEQVGEMIAIPARTLARRKAEGRLSAEESDRLLRAARVYSRALELFEGDASAATEWMTTLNTALGGNAPISYARTELGAEEVENIIGRIEHGVFS